MIFKYNKNADVFGNPQEIKKIKIYPLKLTNYNKYFHYLNILAFYHQKILEGNVYKMSFLQFLLIILLENEILNMRKEKDIAVEDIEKKLGCLGYLHSFFDKKTNNNQFKPFINNFIDIIEECQSYNDFIGFLSLVTNVPIENFSLDLVVSRMGAVMVFINIGDAKFNESEFEELRHIILKQNGIDFDYVKAYDPELEKKMSVIRKSNKVEYANFEEQVLTFCIIMSKNPKEIQDYTFYQFNKMLERHSLLFDYQLYKPLEGAGFIKLKDGEITHYLAHIKQKGRYDDLYIDKDNFTKNTLSKFAKEGK